MTLRMRETVSAAGAAPRADVAAWLRRAAEAALAAGDPAALLYTALVTDVVSPGPYYRPELVVAASLAEVRVDAVVADLHAGAHLDRMGPVLHALADELAGAAQLAHLEITTFTAELAQTDTMPGHWSSRPVEGTAGRRPGLCRPPG